MLLPYGVCNTETHDAGTTEARTGTKTRKPNQAKNQTKNRTNRQPANTQGTDSGRATRNKWFFPRSANLTSMQVTFVQHTVRGTVFASSSGRNKNKHYVVHPPTPPLPLILTLTRFVFASMCLSRGGASVVQKLFLRSRPSGSALDRNVKIKGVGGDKSPKTNSLECDTPQWCINCSATCSPTLVALPNRLDVVRNLKMLQLPKQPQHQHIDRQTITTSTNKNDNYQQQ